MKKIVILLAAFLIVLTGCSSNLDNLEFNKAAKAFDIFNAFSSHGGDVVSAELTMTGEITFDVKFSNEEDFLNIEKTINTDLLDEKRYSQGKRVFAFKESSGKIATFYAESVNDFNSDDIKAYVASDYIDRELYSGNDFSTQDAAVEDFDDYKKNQVVFVFEHVPPFTLSVEGVITCATTEGRQSLEKNQVLFVGGQGIIFVTKDYMLLYILLSVFGVITFTGISLLLIFKFKNQKKK